MPVIFLIVCVLMRLWRCRITLVMINLRKGGEFQVVALNEIDNLLSQATGQRLHKFSEVH